MEAVSFKSVNTGDQLPPFTRTVDQESFWKYAVASFDYNPVHCDPDWVEKAQPFKVPYTVGHGMMTMSFMTSVVTAWALPAMLKIARIESKFTLPVKPGWTVRCTGVIIEKHFISAGHNFVVVEVTAKNQGGDIVGVSKIKVVFPD
jgi:acyl dehydratase